MTGAFDVIIVGLGAMGSATAWHLARRGVKVLGLDRFAVPHPHGSSHGHSRMIRLAYYEHSNYVPLLRRAYQNWADIEQDSGTKLLYQTGGLYMGRPTGGLVYGSIQAGWLYGLEIEVLSSAEVRRRFPVFRLPDDWLAVFEPAAGFLLPENVIQAYTTRARAHGATIRTEEPILHWEATGSSVKVRTAAGEYHADRLILTAGAWTGQLLPMLAPHLQVTRQVLGWVSPADREPFALGRLPVWAIDRPDGSLDYGFPIRPRMSGDSDPEPDGLKLAHHGPGRPASPDTVDRTTTADDEADFRHAIEFIPSLQSATTLAMKTCLYTNSPDHHFIIDRHPAHENVHFAAGFSGHGFKFASVIGEILADLAQNSGTTLPARFLGLSRLSPGS
jgi:sarcosine oxidase